MNFRLYSSLAALICISLASCYPYDEGTHKKKPIKPTVTQTKTPEQIAKEKEAEVKKKAETRKKKAEEQATRKAEEETTSNSSDNTGSTATTSGTTTPATTEHKPTPEVKKPQYSYGTKIPGKDGFVISPYNNKVVDVRDIPSGTLVADPTFPASEKKYFRVP